MTCRAMCEYSTLLFIIDSSPAPLSKLRVLYPSSSFIAFCHVHRYIEGTLVSGWNHAVGGHAAEVYSAVGIDHAINCERSGDVDIATVKLFELLFPIIIFKVNKDCPQYLRVQRSALSGWTESLSTVSPTVAAGRSRPMLPGPPPGKPRPPNHRALDHRALDHLALDDLALDHLALDHLE